MAAGTAYSKRYAGGFFDKPNQTTPEDSAFLNAVEAALLQLIGQAPTADGQVMQWDFANTRYGPALILNKNIDAAAAISKSKLDFTGANGIVNADVAGAAAIARSKLDFGAGLVNADISAAAAIALSKVADPGSGKVIGSNGGAAAVFPPAYEFASVNLSTDSGPTGVTPGGNGDPLMNFPAGTFDGGMVACELTVSPIETGGIVGSYAQFAIAESTTLVTNWVQFVRDQSQPSLPKTTFFKLFFLSAPTAGSHSYTLRWRAPAGGTWTLKSAASGFETTRARIVKV